MFRALRADETIFEVGPVAIALMALSFCTLWGTVGPYRGSLWGILGSIRES